MSAIVLAKIAGSYAVQTLTDIPHQQRMLSMLCIAERQCGFHGWWDCGVPSGVANHWGHARSTPPKSHGLVLGYATGNIIIGELAASGDPSVEFFFDGLALRFQQNLGHTRWRPSALSEQTYHRFEVLCDFGVPEVVDTKPIQVDSEDLPSPAFAWCPEHLCI